MIKNFYDEYEARRLCFGGDGGDGGGAGGQSGVGSGEHGDTLGSVDQSPIGAPSSFFNGLMSTLTNVDLSKAHSTAIADAPGMTAQLGFAPNTVGNVADALTHAYSAEMGRGGMFGTIGTIGMGLAAEIGQAMLGQRGQENYTPAAQDMAINSLVAQGMAPQEAVSAVLGPTGNPSLSDLASLTGFDPMTQAAIGYMSSAKGAEAMSVGRDNPPDNLTEMGNIGYAPGVGPGFTSVSLADPNNPMSPEAQPPTTTMSPVAADNPEMTFMSPQEAMMQATDQEIHAQDPAVPSRMSFDLGALPGLAINTALGVAPVVGPAFTLGNIGLTAFGKPTLGQMAVNAMTAPPEPGYGTAPSLGLTPENPTTTMGPSSPGPSSSLGADSGGGGELGRAFPSRPLSNAIGLGAPDASSDFLFRPGNLTAGIARGFEGWGSNPTPDIRHVVSPLRNVSAQPQFPGFAGAPWTQNHPYWQGNKFMFDRTMPRPGVNWGI